MDVVKADWVIISLDGYIIANFARGLNAQELLIATARIATHFLATNHLRPSPLPNTLSHRRVSPLCSHWPDFFDAEALPSNDPRARIIILEERVLEVPPPHNSLVDSVMLNLGRKLRKEVMFREIAAAAGLKVVGYYLREVEPELCC
ncbi:hypothetical protein P885DRAFT_63315 [Corynascus similis CBS 632.67]